MMIRVDGCQVTFEPPQEARFLVGDFTDWERRPLPMEGPLTLEFPQGAYVEYAFLDAENRPFADPDNPRLAANPWWNYPRAIELPGFVPPASRVPQNPPRVERHRLESAVLGDTRRFYVYEPAQPPRATLVVQDGIAYYRTGKMHEVAQWLWEQGQIPPVRLVFAEPNDRRQEYWFNPRYEGYVLEELLPEVHRLYGRTPQQGVWGASLGGVTALWLAWRHPAELGWVGSQSACLTLEPGGDDSFRAPEWFTARLAAGPAVPLRIYCETGQLEWLLAPNRRLAATLHDRGYSHAYREWASGHNWVTWRQGLEPGLRYLFVAR
jgi:enterochelin esterase-like enzyme